jgi:hypothetical protein
MRAAGKLQKECCFTIVTEAGIVYIDKGLSKEAGSLGFIGSHLTTRM